MAQRSHAKFTDGWGQSWFPSQGNDADPRETRGYLPVPEELRGEDVRLLKAIEVPVAHYSDDPEVVHSEWQVILATPEERWDWDHRNWDGPALRSTAYDRPNGCNKIMSAIQAYRELGEDAKVDALLVKWHAERDRVAAEFPDTPPAYVAPPEPEPMEGEL